MEPQFVNKIKNVERTVGAALRGRPWLSTWNSRVDNLGFGEHDSNQGRPRRAALQYVPQLSIIRENHVRGFLTNHVNRADDKEPRNTRKD